jgi:hypothetical protein
MASRAVHGLLPSADLEALRGWEKLEPQEQSAVRAEYRAITDALYAEGKSRLAIGQHLLKAQEILAPKRLFVRFLKRSFHMSRSTAFNYINLYRAAMEDAPKKVIDIAMSKNYRAVNKPNIFKTYPPPKTTSTAKIIQYLDRLETRKLKVVSVHHTPEILMKRALHTIEVNWNKVPKQERRNWMRSLIGMEMTKFGVGADIEPIPVPETFEVKRGRPSTKKAA